MKRWMGGVATAVLVAWMAPSCATTDVPLATLPEEAGAPIRCASSNDCPLGFYCDEASCDATSGTCSAPPTDCPNNEAPVCGCDGVTYFNDCLRSSRGVAASTPGPCFAAPPCDPTTPCAAGSSCALLTGSCAPDTPVEGTCWVVPAQCPSQSHAPNMWDSCQPGQHCVDTCTAIQSGMPFKRAPECH